MSRSRSSSSLSAGAPELDLERLRVLWPSAVGQVREQNAMVGALLADAKPLALDGGKLTICFPESSEFSKKKAEANRGLLQAALHGLTGHTLGVEFELNGEAEAEHGLSEEELLERLKSEFGAREVTGEDVED